MSGKKALVLIVDGVEELEAVAPIDILRRAKVDVTVAAAGNSLTVQGRDNVRLVADCMMNEVVDNAFDLVVIPGGPGHTALLENPAVIKLVKAQNAKGGLIGSICAGPLVLKAAGILDGKRYTSFPGTADELPARDPTALVVVDGNIVTSQGAGTATNFALALAEALLGTAAARTVADSICFPAYPFG